MQKELTPREQIIFNLLVEGISPKDIAFKLSISNRTLDFHRNNIYKKLDVHSVQELLAKHKSAVQYTETASSTEPESALSGNIKNRKLVRLIPLGTGILIGVVSMLFVWWIFIKPPGVGTKYTARTFDIVYLQANRYASEEDNGGYGENYNTNSAIKLTDFYSAGFDELIPHGDFMFREFQISGTIDIKLKHFTIEFQYAANEPNADGKRFYFLAGGVFDDLKEIGPGDFSVKIRVRRENKDLSELPPGEIEVQLVNKLSAKGQKNPDWDFDFGEKIPDNIRNGAIMATIRNLKIEPQIP